MAGASRTRFSLPAFALAGGVKPPSEKARGGTRTMLSLHRRQLCRKWPFAFAVAILVFAVIYKCLIYAATFIMTCREARTRTATAGRILYPRWGNDGAKTTIVPGGCH
jgi:hypothetical protein